MPATRKLGRPPATSSDETRARILGAARRCFAAQGYGATTNKQLAAEAGLTTGAIYHYFGSKRDLMFAVHQAVQKVVYSRFAAAMETAPATFTARLDAVLDEAVALNREDPSLAQFLVAARTDADRHLELQDGSLAATARNAFFGDLVDDAIAAGEIDAADRQTVLDVISAVMMGLVSASSNDSATHVRTVEGIKRLLTGTLLSADVDP